MKLSRKTVIHFIVILIAVFLAVQDHSGQVNAATISSSVSYTLGTTQSGALTENGSEKQFYKFTTSSSGKIRIAGSAYMKWVYLYIYDGDANEIWRVNLSWNSTSEIIAIDESVFLTSGTYYFCVGRDGGYYGNYNFKLELTPTYESFLETNGGSNNSLATANLIGTAGQSYTAQIALNDEKDFWKFQLGSSGKVTFNATFYDMQWVYWKLFDESGEELYSSNPSYNNTTANINVSDELYLTKGTYFISVSRDGGNYGKYIFSLPFSTSNETYTETNGGSNNSMETASSMSIGKKYSGQIALNDSVDFYKFTLSSDKTITLKVNSSIKWLYIKLFSAKGTEIWSDNPSRSSTTNVISYTRLTKLERGTYYIAIQRDGTCWGNYTVGIEYLTQTNCPHEEYDSSWHSATYFSKGYRLYRCNACGHSYKANYEATKKLGQGYLSRYYQTGRRSLKLNWTTVLDASGYQLRYSKNKSMKKGVVIKTIKGRTKSKKTIKKLSRRKRYYVQVRAYKKSGSKIVYGKWSGKRVFKTK